MIPEVYTRLILMEKERTYTPEAMDNPASAVKLMKSVMHDMDREMMAVVNLDIMLNPINWHVVTIGSSTASFAPGREIFKTAILSNAAQIMLFHNHPSGCIRPSDSDMETTRVIKEAGRLLEIPLVDHIIIGAFNDEYYSFMEYGQI